VDFLSQVSTPVSFHIVDEKWEELRRLAKLLVHDFDIKIRVTTEVGRNRDLSKACKSTVLYILRQSTMATSTGLVVTRTGSKDKWPIVVVGKNASWSHHFGELALINALRRHPVPPLDWAKEQRQAYADIAGVPLWLYPFVGNDQTFDVLRLVQYYISPGSHAVLNGVQVHEQSLRMDMVTACISQHHIFVDYSHDYHTKRLAELRDMDKHFAEGGTG
jgi:hypothetical protein